MYTLRPSRENGYGLWFLKEKEKEPMTKILNEIRERYFARRLKEVEANGTQEMLRTKGADP